MAESKEEFELPEEERRLMHRMNPILAHIIMVVLTFLYYVLWLVIFK